jgi:hypothetical protein
VTESPGNAGPAPTPAPPPLTKPLSAADTAAAAGPRTTTTPPTTPPTVPDDPSLGRLVQTATESVSTLIRSEIELAKLELTSTVKNVGIGAVLFVVAGAIALYSLTFGFFALAEGLAAAGLPRWSGFLIVFGLLLVVAGLAVFVGIKLVKKAKAPERTIATTKETVTYLKNSRS